MAAPLNEVEWEIWLTGSGEGAPMLRRPTPSNTVRIVANEYEIQWPVAARSSWHYMMGVLGVRRYVLGAVSALALICALNPAQAGLIGYAGGGTPAGLYSVDPTTGVGEFVTSVSNNTFTGGLAYLGGQFFISNYQYPNDPAGGFHYGMIDIATGLVTPISLQSPINFVAFAADSAGGFLYVISLNDQGWVLLRVTPGGAIVTIGLLDGVGPFGLAGLAYDNVHGVLYASDYYDGDPELYRVDTGSGAVTAIGSLGLPLANYGGNLPLAFDETSLTLFMTDAVSRSLFSVDVQTGEATQIGTSGSVGQPPGSLAWYPDQPAPSAIPEPTTLAFFGAGLAGAITMRRKKKAA